MLFFSSFKEQEPITYRVVPFISKVHWTGHAQVGTYSPTGAISIKSGSLALNGKSLTSGNMVIDMTTINHKNKQLETHLKGSDFFDVTKFSEAVFVLTSSRVKMVSGNLPIRGITKQITFPVSVKLRGKQLKLLANLKIDRTFFEIKYNSESYFQDLGSYAIRNDIDLSITIQATPELGAGKFVGHGVKE